MLSGWQFMLGGAVMTVFGIAFGGKLGTVSIKGVAILAYLAFLSACAYSLWSILLKYNDVSRVAVCSFLIPVFGFILSSVITNGEKAGAIASVIALILVVTGIIIVNSGGKSSSENI